MLVKDTEQDFLEAYDPRAYEPVAVTVDVVALTVRDDRLMVVALERDTHPFQGKLSLPGMFVKPVAGLDFAPLDWYATQSLKQKAGIENVSVEQMYTSGWPGRDPRMHVISVAYLAFAPDIPDPKPGSNASSARLMTVEEALAVKSPKDWAFDHKGILGRGVIAARNKLEYTSKAIDFLPDEFTIPELKAVYEAVWGQPVDAGNFYRKVKNTSGFIEATLGMRGKAQLFRGNKDVEVYPPIRRGRGDA